MASKKELQARVEALEAEVGAIKEALVQVGQAVQSFHAFAGHVTDRMLTIEKWHGEDMKDAVRALRGIVN